jgi:hypothetical protein
MFTLKPISPSGIQGALEKAERYRLLNEPEAAESICLDVLQVNPANQEALVMLLLSRTDQFTRVPGASEASAQEVVPRLASEYERAYYSGLIAERRGKALMSASWPGSQPMAWQRIRQAMDWYGKATALREEGNDEALLRWNTCARVLNSHPHLAPLGEEEYQPVLDD